MAPSSSVVWAASAVPKRSVSRVSSELSSARRNCLVTSSSASMEGYWVMRALVSSSPRSGTSFW